MKVSNNAKFKPLAREWVRELSLAVRNPAPSSPQASLPAQSVRRAYSLLQNLLTHRAQLSLSLLREGLFVEDVPVDDAGTAELLEELQQKDIQEVTFPSQLSLTEFQSFLCVLREISQPPQEKGRLTNLFQEKGIRTIRIKEAGLAQEKTKAEADPPPRPDRESAEMKTSCPDPPPYPASGAQRKPAAANIAFLLSRLRAEGNVEEYLQTAESLKEVFFRSRRGPTHSYVSEAMGHLLCQKGLISHLQLQHALAGRQRNGMSLAYNLAELSYVSEEDLLAILAEHYKGYPAVSFTEREPIPAVVLKAIPEQYIRKYKVLPLQLIGRKISLALCDPCDLKTLTDLQFITGLVIFPHVAAEYHLCKAIERYYGISPSVASQMGDTLSRAIEVAGAKEAEIEEEIEFVKNSEDEEEIVSIEELSEMGMQSPIIKLTNLILREAINQRASDIHIEPFEENLRIRFRVDGTLHTVMTPPPGAARTPSFPASRFWPSWILPSGACPRTARCD